MRSSRQWSSPPQRRTRRIAVTDVADEFVAIETSRTAAPHTDEAGHDDPSPAGSIRHETDERDGSASVVTVWMPNSQPSSAAVSPEDIAAVQRQEGIKHAVQDKLCGLCATRDEDEPIASDLGDATLEFLPWRTIRSCGTTWCASRRR